MEVLRIYPSGVCGYILRVFDIAGIHDAEDSDQAGEQAGVDFEDDDETDDEQENYLTDDSYDPDNMTYEVIKP